VEQVVAEGWEGVAGDRAGHTRCRKQAVPASISNQRRVSAATGNPGGGTSNQRGSASRQIKPVSRGAEGVQEDARATGWMLRSAKMLPRRQR
jgi:hypothetical protein